MPVPLSPWISTEPEGNGTVRLTVRDSGVGIAPDMLSRLFEPFYTTKARGTGLGMAIAFAAGLAWGELAFPTTNVPLIRGGDGLSVSMLTGAYVPR